MKNRETQRERFEQTARELGVDLDEEKLKEALRKLGRHDAIPSRDGLPEKVPATNDDT